MYFEKIALLTRDVEKDTIHITKEIDRVLSCLISDYSLTSNEENTIDKVFNDYVDCLYVLALEERKKTYDLLEDLNKLKETLCLEK